MRQLLSYQLLYLDMSQNDLTGNNADAVFCQRLNPNLLVGSLFELGLDCLGDGEDPSAVAAEIICSCCTKCCRDNPAECIEDGEEVEVQQSPSAASSVPPTSNSTKT